MRLTLHAEELSTSTAYTYYTKAVFGNFNLQIAILSLSFFLIQFKFQVSSLLRIKLKHTKYNIPLLAVSYSYSRRAVA